MKSRTTAALLALFLGAFGVHRFYLRQPGLGMFYLLGNMFIAVPFLRIPLGVFLGVIDCIVFFLMSDEEFDKRYNEGKPARAGQRRTEDRERRSAPRRGAQMQRGSQHRQPKRRQPSPKQRKNPFKLSGQKKLEAYQLSEAIKDLNQSLTIFEEDKEVHYMLAQAHSLSEHSQDAYYHLGMAVKYGFKDFERIHSDESLAFLRVHKDFKAFKEAGYRVTRPPSPSEGTSVNDPTLLAQLERLAEMRRQGLLTEQDYQIERQRIQRRQ